MASPSRDANVPILHRQHTSRTGEVQNVQSLLEGRWMQKWQRLQAVSSVSSSQATRAWKSETTNSANVGRSN